MSFDQKIKSPFKILYSLAETAVNKIDFRLGPTYNEAQDLEKAQKELFVLIKDCIRKRGFNDHDLRLQNANFLKEYSTIFLTNRTSDKSFRNGIYLNSSYDEVIQTLKNIKENKKDKKVSNIITQKETKSKRNRK